ncbi:hypothetical protein TcWFU_007800 [Taenia crassiceps]|uniref:Uncharacterized protein n=1 Tax=Taenia crassiceps TaxID=6207 RepID=A0ABR4QJK6_9CEST
MSRSVVDALVHGEGVKVAGVSWLRPLVLDVVFLFPPILSVCVCVCVCVISGRLEDIGVVVEFPVQQVEAERQGGGDNATGVCECAMSRSVVMPLLNPSLRWMLALGRGSEFMCVKVGPWDGGGRGSVCRLEVVAVLFVGETTILALREPTPSPCEAENIGSEEEEQYIGVVVEFPVQQVEAEGKAEATTPLVSANAPCRGVWLEVVAVLFVGETTILAMREPTPSPCEAENIGSEGGRAVLEVVAVLFVGETTILAMREPTPSPCEAENIGSEEEEQYIGVVVEFPVQQVEAEGKAEATTPLVSANAPCRGVWLEVVAVLFVGETTILAMREPTPSPCEAENIGSEEEEQCGCFGPRRGCEGGQVSWLRPLVLDVVFLFPPILSLCVCVCVCVCVISGRLEDIGVVVEFPVQQVEAEGKAEATTPLVSANAPCRGVWLEVVAVLFVGGCFGPRRGCEGGQVSWLRPLVLDVVFLFPPILSLCVCVCVCVCVISGRLEDIGVVVEFPVQQVEAERQGGGDNATGVCECAMSRSVVGGGRGSVCGCFGPRRGCEGGQVSWLRPLVLDVVFLFPPILSLCVCVCVCVCVISGRLEDIGVVVEFPVQQVEAEGKAEATTPLVSANAPCRGVWLEVVAVLFVGETTILAMREPTPSPCEAENIGSEEEEQCGCFGPRRGCEGGQVSWLRPLVLDVVFLFPPILSLCVCVCVCVCVISGRLEDIGVVVEFPVQQVEAERQGGGDNATGVCECAMSRSVQVEAEGKAEATTPLVSANAPCRGVWLEVVAVLFVGETTILAMREPTPSPCEAENIGSEEEEQYIGVVVEFPVQQVEAERQGGGDNATGVCECAMSRSVQVEAEGKAEATTPLVSANAPCRGVWLEVVAVLFVGETTILAMREPTPSPCEAENIGSEEEEQYIGVVVEFPVQQVEAEGKAEATTPLVSANAPCRGVWLEVVAVLFVGETTILAMREPTPSPCEAENIGSEEEEQYIGVVVEFPVQQVEAERQGGGDNATGVCECAMSRSVVMPLLNPSLRWMLAPGRGEFMCVLEVVAVLFVGETTILAMREPTPSPCEAENIGSEEEEQSGRGRRQGGGDNATGVCECAMSRSVVIMPLLNPSFFEVDVGAWERRVHVCQVEAEGKAEATTPLVSANAPCRGVWLEVVAVLFVGETTILAMREPTPSPCEAENIGSEEEEQYIGVVVEFPVQQVEAEGKAEATTPLVSANAPCRGVWLEVVAVLFVGETTILAMREPTPSPCEAENIGSEEEEQYIGVVVEFPVQQVEAEGKAEATTPLVSANAPCRGVWLEVVAVLFVGETTILAMREPTPSPCEAENIGSEEEEQYIGVVVEFPVQQVEAEGKAEATTPLVSANAPCRGVWLEVVAVLFVGETTILAMREPTPSPCEAENIGSEEEEQYIGVVVEFPVQQVEAEGKAEATTPLVSANAPCRGVWLEVVAVLFVGETTILAMREPTPSPCEAENIGSEEEEQCGCFGPRRGCEGGQVSWLRPLVLDVVFLFPPILSLCVCVCVCVISGRLEDIGVVVEFPVQQVEAEGKAEATTPLVSANAPCRGVWLEVVAVLFVGGCFGPRRGCEGGQVSWLRPLVLDVVFLFPPILSLCVCVCVCVCVISGRLEDIGVVVEFPVQQVEAEGKAEATTPLVSANAPCRGVWLEVVAVLFVGETTILAMREPTPSPCEAENIGSEEEEQYIGVVVEFPVQQVEAEGKAEATTPLVSANAPCRGVWLEVVAVLFVGETTILALREPTPSPCEAENIGSEGGRAV